MFPSLPRATIVHVYSLMPVRCPRQGILFIVAAHYRKAHKRKRQYSYSVSEIAHVCQAMSACARVATPSDGKELRRRELSPGLPRDRRKY